MKKEFICNNGYYYEFTAGDTFGDLACGEVYMWHHCSDKPMRLTAEQFRYNQFHHGACCPNCKEPVQAWEKMNQWHEYTRKGEIPGLSFRNIHKAVVETDCDTVSIHTYVSQYKLPEGAGSFIKMPDEYRCYRMNVLSGISYVLLPSKPGGSSLKKQKYKRINISFSPDWAIVVYRGSCDLPDGVMSLIRDEIQKRVRLFHFAQAPDFEKYDVKLTLGNLVRYIRCPYICPKLYGNIITSSRRDRHVAEYLKKMGSIPRELIAPRNCQNPIEHIIAQSRIPNVKSLRRLVYEYPEGLSLLASISRSFQNIDIICSLYDAYIDCRAEYNESYVDFSADVFQTMVRHKGEQIIASKLLAFARHASYEDAYTTLGDMIDAYDRLRQCDFDFAGSYDIDELHMYLASSVAKQDTVNRPIEYTPEELALEFESGGFSIKAARDTYELADVGARMHICVGAYGDGAVEKVCLIFLLRHTGNPEPIGCIEVCGGTVVQAKGKYNQMLEKDELDFVRGWARANKLKVRTSDLPEWTEPGIPA